MKARLTAIAIAVVALSGGLFVAPAAADTSTTTNVVNDEGTSSPWSGSEEFGASAYDTAVVTPDVSAPAGGTLTYLLFTSGTCDGTQLSSQTVNVNSMDGTVPPSDPTAVLDAGTYSFEATYNGDGTNDASPGVCESFTIGEATPGTPSITNLPSNPTWSSGGGFTATLSDTGSDGVQSVTSSTTDVCTTSGLAVTYVTAGPCALTAQTAASTNDNASAGTQQTFTIGQATPTPPTISNLPAGGAYLGTFTASVSTNGDGTTSVTTNSSTVCQVGSDGLTVTFVDVGNCSLTAHVAEGTDYTSADGSAQSFTVSPATASTPTMTNLPNGASFGGSFVASISTNGDGTKSVTSNSTGVCVVASNGLTVSYVGVGTCSLTAHVAAGTEYAAADGSAQTFSVGRATPSSPSIANIPSGATEFASFVATVATTGDGKGSVTSESTGVCTVGPDGVTVTFVGFGTCTLIASVAQGAHYLGGTGVTQSFPVNPAARGYWLVGSDGGIFSFGAAGFYGSMGGIPLQRPVVGITPTASRNGYWLVASDGGIFSFGDSSYYGSIPGIGLHPAGSGLPDSLDAPIVGMVPSTSGHGYFMVASDGGVFAFGDARFAGSCPGIGGCEGAAVAVMPDSTGNGYWLVTNIGAVYTFGDAPFYGAPSGGFGPVVDAVATPDGLGYWILYANGAVVGFGDAVGMGAPLGYVNSFNPAASIFPTADGKGYWVAAARGDVFAYGDAPYMGSMAAAGLNGLIIAGFGF
jgi:hypothetical protein